MPRAKHRSNKRWMRHAREFAAVNPPRTVTMPTKTYEPPPWLVKGAKVHFSFIIGEPPSDPAKMNATVLAEPFQVNGAEGTWCTLIDKHRGWVACEALTQAVP